MTELNFAPSLGTLARNALRLELLADGLDRSQVDKLVSRLEIRERPEPSPFGVFARRVRR